MYTALYPRPQILKVRMNRLAWEIRGRGPIFGQSKRQFVFQVSSKSTEL